MRIALIHYSFEPVVGGVERVIGGQARVFAANGHDVTLIGFSGGIEGDRTRVLHLPQDADAAELCFILQPLLGTHDLVLMHNVCTMPFHFGLTSALRQLADELRNVRFISWMHDLAVGNPDYNVALGSEMHQALSRVHPQIESVAISDLRAEQFCRVSGAPRSRCRVVPNGIEPAEVLGLSRPTAELERRYGLLERDFVLLHPARLLKRKNIELGLRVCDALARAGSTGAYLVTAAPEPHTGAARQYGEELRELAKSAPAEWPAVFVNDHLAVTHGQLAALFTIADALFFPSHQEGFGLPVVEAALHRLPVFCSDIAPLNRFPGGKCFPLDAEPDAIAEMIRLELDSSVAMHARKAVVRRYGWERIYERHLAPLLAEARTSIRT